jgi:hypothetical protein
MSQRAHTMKKLVCLTALSIALTWGLPRIIPLAMAYDPCELYSRADAESLFKESVSEGVARETMSPAGRICSYTFKKNGDMYGLKVRISTTSAIQEEGLHDSAADVMERQKKARKASEQAVKTFRAIPELGDDAFWNGSDLWVLKGDVLILVTVNAFVEGSFKDMAAADMAREEQNLALARTAATTILARLK